MPFAIAVVVGLCVFGIIRKRVQRLHGTAWLRLISALVAGGLMSVLGLAAVWLFRGWATSPSMSDTGTALGVLVMTVNAIGSVLLAAFVGTGIGRSTEA